MSKNVLPLALTVIAIALGLAGCQPAAAPDTRSQANVAAEPQPREKFDSAAIEAELIKLEREWVEAAKNRDGEAVKRVVADDLIITYPDGVTGTKAEEVRAIEMGFITAESWELLDPKVTVLNADAAFITGRGIIKNGKYKDDKMQRAVDISGEYRFLDVYARRDGKWQAVASQTTQVRNPAPAQR